jgi:hypothetical protein
MTIQHGTLTGAKIHHCNCPPCHAAGSRYDARRRLLIATGRWQQLANAQPVRDHIRHLRANGLGWRHIAHLAGVSEGVVSRLIYGTPSRGYGPSKRLHPDASAALLAVQVDLDTLADRALIDATGTRRRIQALTCIGWSQTEQARRLGVSRQSHTRLNSTPQVTAGLARTIRAFYDELSMTPAPAGPSSTGARREAARKKWAPPLAWDDDTIDDPAARPDLGEKVLKPVALLENFEELLALGYTSERAAERLEVSRDYLIELRRRARVRERVAA